MRQTTASKLQDQDDVDDQDLFVTQSRLLAQYRQPALSVALYDYQPRHSDLGDSSRSEGIFLVMAVYFTIMGVIAALVAWL